MSEVEELKEKPIVKLTPQDLATIYADRPFTEDEIVHITSLITKIEAKKKKSSDDHFWFARLKSYLPTTDAPIQVADTTPQHKAVSAKTSTAMDKTPSGDEISLNTQQQLVIKQLNEKLYHQSINPIAEAKALKKAIEVLELSQKELAGYIHKSERYLSDTLALLGLPRPLQDKIKTGEIKPASKSLKDAIRSVRGGDSVRTKDVLKNITAFNASDLPTIAIQRDVAIALCQLLKTHSDQTDNLIELDIDNESATREIQSVLHQHAYRVLAMFSE